MLVLSHARVCWFIAILGCCTAVTAQVNVNLFDDFSTVGLPGRLMIPDEAANSPRPVILFLHGAGERGTDNALQVNGNINNLISAAEERGAFIYAPQNTSGSWNTLSRTNLVMTMVDRLLDEQNADPNRVYVTGLSLGGGGSWTMSSRYADHFAANVPIAGVAPGGDFRPDYVLDVPTWAFHARNDGVVAASRSRERVNLLLAAANKPTLTFPANTAPTFEFVDDNLDLRYTEFQVGGHGIWSNVYNTPAMYDWMFSKAVPEPTAGWVWLLAVCWFVVRRPQGIRIRRNR